MRLFEYFFNQKKEAALLSFIYEPQNIYEKKMGGLFMAGMMKNILPQNASLLNDLSQYIKDRFYRMTIFNSSKAFKEILNEINFYLEKMAKKGNVSWLGNLSLSILNLDPNFEMRLSATGKMKVFLLREKEIINIDEKLKTKSSVYPFQIFSNIVYAKLKENDVILMLTYELSEFFQKSKIFEKIAASSVINENSLKKIFLEEKEELAKISGVFQYLELTKEVFTSPKKDFFALNEIKNPLASFNSLNNLKKIFSNLSKPKFKFFNYVLFDFNNFKTKKISFLFNQKFFLIFIFIFILFLGAIFFRYQNSKELAEFSKKISLEISLIEEKNFKAEQLISPSNLASQKDANKIEAIKLEADRLFEENFKEIISLEDRNIFPKEFKEKFLELKEKTFTNLSRLNHLENIENPKLFFEFTADKFIPLRFFCWDNNFYFFNPYAKNLFKIDDKKQEKNIKLDQSINFATVNNDVFLFSKSNKIFILEKNDEIREFNFTPPYDNANFISMFSYGKYLYFLEKTKGEIMKYSFSNNFLSTQHIAWLSKNTAKLVNPEYGASDGSIFVLNSDNSIAQYYQGNLLKIIKINTFPQVKDFSKIFILPNFPYLYILEPVQKRIIIADKNGNVLRQFQSEKFDNLLDFVVSEEGKNIWLLNGLKVFEIAVK